MAFWGLIGSSALIWVATAAIHFVFNQLSNNEIRRQEQLLEEYHAYESRRRQEEQDIKRYYDNLRNQEAFEYEQKLISYQKKNIERRKKENKATSNKILMMYNEQYNEKKKLLEECKLILKNSEQSVEHQQKSYMRFKSIKSTLISLQEAAYKLEAYLQYLNRYRRDFEKLFECEGCILEPFSMTLPNTYPYEGKLIFFKRNQFKNQKITLEEYGDVFLDKSDKVMFDRNDDNAELPFMIHGSAKGQYYLSLKKGAIKNSIGGTIGIDAEVISVKKNIVLQFMGDPYIRLILNRRDLISQHRRTPIGSNLHVYVKDYDFALKKRIFVSEKLEDSLTIAQFGYIILVQNEREHQEYQELHDCLEKEGLLEADDEWQIGPIMDESKNLIGVIMQLGYQFGFRAFFEEIEQNCMILRYKEILPRDELMSFDDIFVAGRVTLCWKDLNKVRNHLREFASYFEDCRRLQLYLLTEFNTQRQLMVKSPMSVYFNQWAEITNRLIDYMSYGQHIKLSVVEWRYVTIRKIFTNTVLTVDNQAKLKTFLEKEGDANRNRFFIEIIGEEKKRLSCRIAETKNGELEIRLNGRIEKHTLIDNNFELDMYSVSIPYAEKQHANAFSMFKEGYVVSEVVKAAIINTNSLIYQDNGYRIDEFFNKSIQTNKNQLDAIIRAFSAESFFLIQGPPGTGKTTVIRELIIQQLRHSPKARILVVSQANVAVDNVLRGISEISKESENIEDRQIVRCGIEEKIDDEIKSYSFDKKYEKYKYDLIHDLPEDDKTLELRQKWLEIINHKDNKTVVGECLLSCFQIIGATCVGLESRNYGLNNMEFDLVVIDEAGKALPGELLIPINHAKKVIIIGDHKQLPPVINPALYKGGKVQYEDVVEDEQRNDFLNRSFFQRLYDDCPDNLKCMLDIQFRMPPVIANLVNMFYDGKLKTGKNCFGKAPIFCNNHLIFIDMKGEPDYKETDKGENGNSVSPYNHKEVEAAIAVVTKIRAHYDKRIVLITPYKRQKYELMKGFRKVGLQNVWINTIDAFQGDEENVVIYCTTRADKPTKYFSDAARLNVAFSRSKNTLIFLGSSSYLKKYHPDHILHKVSNYLDEYAKIIPYQELVRDGFDLSATHSARLLAKSGLDDEIQPLNLEILSNEIFDGIKNSVVSKQTKCIKCGKALTHEETLLCESCATKYEKQKCESCGNIFYVTNYDKYKNPDKVIRRFCLECREKKNKANELVEVGICEVCKKPIFEKRYKVTPSSDKKPYRTHKECWDKVFVTKECVTCHSEFSLTYGEKIYYDSKEFPLPKRCPACRKKKDNSNEKQK